MPNIDILASLSIWGDWFESRFDGNPEDRFSRGEAHMINNMSEILCDAWKTAVFWFWHQFFVFNVPPTGKVILRQGHCLVSYLTYWSNWGSNSGHRGTRLMVNPLHHGN